MMISKKLTLENDIESLKEGMNKIMSLIQQNPIIGIM